MNLTSQNRWGITQATVAFAFVSVMSFSGGTEAQNGKVSSDVAIVKMSSGGISLRRDSFKFGLQRKSILFHLYVVPKVAQVKGKAKEIKRQDIVAGTSIPTSPFVLDIFARQGRDLKHLNSVRFLEKGDVLQIEARWLQPKQRRGPVVLLRFGVGDEGEWKVISFPRGLTEKPVLQTFGFGMGRDESWEVRFDQMDRKGFMIIKEEAINHNTNHGKTQLYHWSRKGFRLKRRKPD